ncbi:MAG: hypothetical protein J7L55_00425 [Desulfurococcales archaeon]|nr:hypothetical protein [Desulfurococcales archaeon]
MGVVREFLEMVTDGVLMVNACLVRRGRIVECFEHDPELEDLAEYSVILPSVTGHVFLVYRRGSAWVHFLVPLGRDFWLVFKASYLMLGRGRNFSAVMRSLANMSFKVGNIISARGGGSAPLIKDGE